MHHAAEIAARVRRERKARGLNQAELADLAGVGRRFVSELENGKESVRLREVLRVLAVFGLTLQVDRPVARP